MGSYKVLYDYPNYASLPAVGDVSRLYITNDTNTLYRWVDGAYHFFTTTSVPWGNIDGVLTNQTDLMAVLNGKQPLITAGTTAQYYRGDKTFQTLNTTAVPEGTNLYWTDARFNTGFSGKTTSNLTEGTNLYYTDARFDARLATKSTTNLAEGTNLYYTQGRFDSAFGAKSTSNLAEGTNLYYTDARFDTRLASKTTDNLTEGATRLYYSSGRFNADFNSKTTDNLTEGANNFYWTLSRSRNALTLLTVGTGGLATYNSTTGQLNIPQYQTLLTNPLVGAGAQYYVPRYYDTTTLTPGLIYDNGVYVGINRTNPFYTLDVNGTLNVQGVSIYRNLAGTGSRLVYVDSTGTLTPAIIGSGLSMVSGTLSATGTASGSIGGSGTIDYIPKFSGTAAITNSNIQDSGSLITLNSNSYVTGSLGIGDTNLTGFSIRISKNITGGTTTWGIHQQGVVQSDVTGTVNGFSSAINTQATSFTLTNYNHFRAVQGTLGVGSAVTNQYGFVADSSLVGAANNFGFYGNIASASGRWNLYMAGTANNYMAGSLGIGGTTFTGYNGGKLFVGKPITGSINENGIALISTIQSDVTNAAVGIITELSTQSTTFTLSEIRHYQATQGTFGAGSTVNSQTGFWVGSNLTGATNNYGFRGYIPTGSNNWNLYMSGTANNYLAGSLGIGNTSLTGYNLLVAKNITGSSVSYNIYSGGNIQSDVTSIGSYYFSSAGTQATTFSLSQLIHYNTYQNTFGSGSSVNAQVGFQASNTLIGATFNYGFRGLILSATNNWNLYMDGTANNYLAGSLGVGTTSLTGTTLSVSKNITGSVNAYSTFGTGVIQSDVTNKAAYFSSYALIQNTAFSISNINHFEAVSGLSGSATITNQIGFLVGSSLTQATNNFGFYGSIPSATNNYNLYMPGTANNYLAGSLGIGTASLTGYNLRITKNLTGGTSAYGSLIDGVVQSDVTGQAYYYQTYSSTQNTAFTLPQLGHFFASGNSSFGSSTVSIQTGFWAGSALIGAVTNYGFRGQIASSANRWNLYMDGTAQNYLAGALSIGVTTANASALLQVDSTTQGVLFPRMTTTQKNAISSPAVGLIVYDTTLNKLCVYTGAWQTITSA